MYIDIICFSLFDQVEEKIKEDLPELKDFNKKIIRGAWLTSIQKKNI
ncbi:MAG: hypothetical protein ACTHWZ_03960 [Peptoniphilaceae bacterium]